MLVTIITPKYVPGWSSYEVVREVMQNAKDEEEQHGHKMNIKHHRGWLRISNHGATISRKALLLGESTKAHRPDLRGQYGEGLDLAMLAAVRCGYEMRVYTRTEIWTPKIEYVARLDSEVLVIYTRKLKTEGTGVEVRIKMPLTDWLDTRKLFRFLVGDEEDDTIELPEGTILIHPDRKGMIFAKGIYVNTLPSLEYGYDLKEVKLDRDRKMVNVWDLRWELAAMLKRAVAKAPDKLAAPVYKMLRDKTEEANGFQYHTDDAFAEAMAARFKEEHGEDAVPVTSMAESQQLDHVGAEGIVVADTLKAVLEKKIKGAEEVRRELEYAVDETHSWHELEPGEQQTLQDAITSLQGVTEAQREAVGLAPLLDRLQVVTYRQEAILGQCNKSGALSIARRLLDDPRETLVTLVHEEAHALSQASDGSKCHLGMIQEIWVELDFGKGN